ncbi:MAG: MBL fold metallo-hydrolase [Clostridia bacterium]|nr:MBL fold metallo-hydrolase [Clostridia bacterium]
MKLSISTIKKSIPLLKKAGVAAGFISAAKPSEKNDTAPIVAEALFVSGGDRVHFLNTGRSDCILIQSNGHFALVDCSDEQHIHTVTDYLKKVAGDENGVVHLDFLAVTHAHEGHMGGVKQLLSDGKISVDTVYIKPLCDDKFSDVERQLHSSAELFKTCVDAVRQAGIKLVSEIPADYFDFGSFRLRFVNTEPDNYHIGVSENDNSLGLLISKGDKKLLLTGDMVNDTGDLARLANLFGRVDVLQLPCHGQAVLSKDTIKAFSPEVMIATNSACDIPHQILGECMLNSDGKLYSTVENDGVIVTFAENGTLCLTKDIHKIKGESENA